MVLTISLGENILGRLSKVNVGGRYSHDLQRKRTIKAVTKNQTENKAEQQSCLKITSLLSSLCVTALGQQEARNRAEGKTR